MRRSRFPAFPARSSPTWGFATSRSSATSWSGSRPWPTATRAAWDEAQRRVWEHPNLKTVVLDRYTGATLWQSDPDTPALRGHRDNATAFYALEIDLPLPGDVLSSHKEKDDAWSGLLRSH